ncbi:MAG: hypothetical protein QOG72_965 [Sphingomonadales bacterium]|jgi:hypothetical protein|nr:hypothetical protein [Sphingomonadales bacterium]
MARPVIPAKAGTPGREVSAGLPEVPACAGMTGGGESVVPEKAGIPAGEDRRRLSPHGTPGFAGVTR